MSLPRISWHIGDYLKDTGHLRAAGHGAYFMLCLHYYANGKLPEDDLSLASIARLTDQEWKKYKPILQAFFHDGWHHKRMDKEIRDAKERYDKRALAGSKGGIAAAATKQKPSNAVAMLATENGNAEATLTTNQGRKEDTADAVSSPGKYAFECGVIRLLEKDLGQWKRDFSYLDVPAELNSLADFAQKNSEKWFFAVSGALAKRNREVKAKRDANPKVTAGGWV